MNITTDHKNTKNPEYWNDLIAGTTSQYKEVVMAQLIDKHFKKTAEAILDIGCGTCETILKYGALLQAKHLYCIDYDAKIIEQMKAMHKDKPIEWRVADLFDLKNFHELVDLVLFMDMLHEIYSFYGRPQKDIQSPVDHTLGQTQVRQALKNMASRVKSGGGIIITDNVLCEEDVSVTIRLKSPQMVETVKYFLEHYTTRRFAVRWTAADELIMNSRDFCILLTQYNKIKHKNWERWSTERYEIHQYMTRTEYEETFCDLGFVMHATIGTPQDTMREWEEDFAVIKGLSQIPEKRITLLGIKT